MEKGLVLGELEYSEGCCDYSYCRCIKVEEVKGAICRMRRGGATGLNEIPMDLLKCTSRAGIGWLTELFNDIFKMLKVLRWRMMVPPQLKDKFYGVAVHSTVLYGTKCWPDNSHILKLKVAKMRMLKWM
ncbi:uncharacterized protein LOC124887919 [Capsicum annuum]|uniref:uncharacterized protein LOC124887919 n=1 Tax=Capsicum annuum TaxID=4072 RepID=UPI001FB10300|nr:uncharacterized protein LOC124887919 [Capsicum annuum]